MGGRRPNPRLVKIHRNYTVQEVTKLLEVHPNTVRNWMKGGLKTLDDRRPTLILGPDLREFLLARRKRAKQTCRDGELYCVKCRAPKRPAGAMVDCKVVTPTFGNLRGICPDCDGLIYRGISMAKMALICADLEVAFWEGQERITEPVHSPLNCDSSKGP